MNLIIAFDLNGTLIDTNHVSHCFRVYTDSESKQNSLNTKFWNHLFHKLQLSVTEHSYRPFEDLVKDSLNEIQCPDVYPLFLSEYINCPVYKDVPEFLAELKSMNFHLAVLTNSSLQLMNKVKETSGLGEVIDYWISSEEVSSHKPSASPYELLSRLTPREENESIVFISAHSWDCIGAAKAGLSTIHLSRDKPQMFDRRVISISDLSLALPIIRSMAMDVKNLLKAKIE
ncbi:hypothetical protein GEMRC1_008926 [Eukaryota sp. GEM-RC1]